MDLTQYWRGGRRLPRLSNTLLGLELIETNNNKQRYGMLWLSVGGPSGEGVRFWIHSPMSTQATWRQPWARHPQPACLKDSRGLWSQHSLSRLHQNLCYQYHWAKYLPCTILLKSTAYILPLFTRVRGMQTPNAHWKNQLKGVILPNYTGSARYREPGRDG